eukprot:CAMPEP_0196661158 /NCGR_PEP_ID=MMETSP1086-20130531/43013_1 /TAXON_ID=77921 /ORGANISM="Cyanoptyche  gloeocystis , Strain SAG4.97" /LENGTH=67 /DNA_ID=CAMNT_0041995931 /DNA_START=54 /DNA_END=258 /DNA_ORIENTATION=+
MGYDEGCASLTANVKRNFAPAHNSACVFVWQGSKTRAEHDDLREEDHEMGRTGKGYGQGQGTGGGHD